MSSRVAKIARSFKTASAVIYFLGILCAVTFSMFNFYLESVSAGFTAFLCIIMLIATSEKPRTFHEKLSNSKFEFVYTLQGRAVLDIIAALFLFAFGGFGFILATTLLGLLLGIFICGMQMPDLLPELFAADATAGSVEMDDGSTSYSRT